MIAIPKVLFLVLLEVILVLMAAVGLLWYRGRRNRGKRDASDEEKSLRARIAELESERETSVSPGEGRDLEPAALTVIRTKHGTVLDSIQNLVSSLEGQEGHEEELQALVSAGAALTSAIEAAGKGEELPEGAGFKEISLDDGPEEAPFPEVSEAPASEESTEATGDPPGRSFEDILLMMSLQLKIIREQEAAIGFVQARLAGEGAEGGEMPVADENLFEAQKGIAEAVSLLETELSELKQTGPGGTPPGNTRELETSRKKVAELQAELDRATAQIASLEKEYDILYSKTATENPHNM